MTFAVSPVGGGTTSPTDGPTWYNDGSLNIQANPSTGYDFTSWSVTTTSGTISFGSTSSASTTATIHGSGTITATFTIQQFTITFDATADGSPVHNFADIAGSEQFLTITSPASCAGTYQRSHLPQPCTAQYGDTVTFSYQSTVVSQTPGKQYVWRTTTGLASGQSGSFSATASGTITAAYVSQDQQTFTNTGLGGDANAGTLVTLTVTVGQCSATTISIPGGSVYCDTNTQYSFSFSTPIGSSVTGKRYRFASASMTSPITVSTSNTINGNYVTQYQVTFDQSGLDNTATGTVLTLNGVTTHTKADLPLTDWFDSGTTYTYSNSVSTSDPGKRFALTGVTGPSSPITASGAVTATYVTQYKLTVTSAHDLPNPAVGDNWFNAGSPVTASVTSPTDLSGGTRYVSTGWIGTGDVPSSGTGTTTTFNINQPSTITWNWIAQYLVTYAQTGCSLTVSLPTSEWVNSGGAATGIFPSPVLSGDGKTRCVFQHDDRAAINAPTTVTATYDTEFDVSYAQTGCVGPTVTLPNDEWVVSGGSAIGTFPATVTDLVGTTRCTFVSSSPASGPVNAPTTITGTYQTEYYFTVSSAHDSVTGQGWYPANALVSSTVTSPTDDDGHGTRYSTTGWTGTGSAPASGTTDDTGSFNINTPSSVTWDWIPQYELTMATNFGTTDPSVGGGHWYDVGSTVTITATPPAAGTGERYVFDGWTGSGSGSFTGTDNPATNVGYNERSYY